MAKWWKWVINPIGAVAQTLTSKSDSEAGKWANMLTNPGDFIKDTYNLIKGFGKDSVKGMFDNALNNIAGTDGDPESAVSKLWNDYTGQTAIDKQFEANKELAQYQTNLQEELYNKYSSPEALMRQYSVAGLNPNLAYGSASSGQSNVPSYQAPSAPLNLSYSDKFNKALSMMSSVLGVKNLVYSTVANREAAEQSYLKTLRENEALKSDERNNIYDSLVKGYFSHNYLNPKRYSKTYGQVFSYGDQLERYSAAVRSELFNRSARAAASNAWDFGYYKDGGDNIFKFELPDFFSNSYWDNYNKKYAGKKRQFDYEWDNDYKTMLKGAGVAAPIIQTLLRILGGK